MITGKIIDVKESADGRANIAIHVEFSEDGVVVVPDWTLWARMENFLGMTAQQIEAWIRVNIEHQIGNLILAKNRGKINTEFMASIDLLKATPVAQADKVEIEMEASKVIVTPYTVIVNQDGTVTVK